MGGKVYISSIDKRCQVVVSTELVMSDELESNDSNIWGGFSSIHKVDFVCSYNPEDKSYVITSLIER